MKKKLLSVLLATVLLLTCIPLGAVSVSAETHSHPICGTNCSCADVHSAKTWQAFPTGTMTLSSGNYYLTSSIGFTGTNRLTIGGNVSICLNGYSIYKNGNSSVVIVESGTLTLSDCKGTGKISVTDNAQTSFSGGGALSITGSGSLNMYGGTVSCTSFVGAIYCNTTGNLSVYGGTITGYREAVDVYNVNDVTVYGGSFKSETTVALSFGDSYSYSTFHDVTISGGYFEGEENGAAFGGYATCTGKVTISGGEFYGKGPEPNATTYAMWYYGLAFTGADCNLTISGGVFRGARGGFYNSNSDLNVIVSGGTFMKPNYSSYYGNCGIAAAGGTFLIEGGTIYGISSGNSTRDVCITVTDGEILFVKGSSSSTSVFSLKVYGGTIGQVGATMATSGIASFPANIEVYRGTILGTDYAINYAGYLTYDGSVLISGGTLSGGIADVLVGKFGATADTAPLSLDGYTGDAVSVALWHTVKDNGYVANDASHRNLVSIVSDHCSEEYDNANGAIKVNLHNYNKTVISPTCISTGYTRYVCSACGDTYTSNTTAVVAHNYKTTVTEPSCAVEGLKTYTCSVCGNSYTESIPATGEHTYSNVCDTTCNACGTGRNAPHTYTNNCDAVCDACGFERTPGEHRIINGVCTFTNDTTYPFAWSESGGYYYSTNQSHSSTATVTLTAMQDGTITIRHATSTEATYDKLIIKQNDTTTVTRSGETSWESTTFTVVAGDKIYISYSKDSSVSRNLDMVYFQITEGLAEEMEPTCEQAVVCLECGEIVKEALGHTYDNDYDPDCNICGDVREVETPMAFGGNSVSEDVSGLAFRFDLAAQGVTKDRRNVADLSNATVNYLGRDCKLIAMGAVMTNDDAVGATAFTLEDVYGDRVVDVPAVYLQEAGEAFCAFATRIIDIPDTARERTIYARPYYVVEVDGQQITVYGDVDAASYNSVLA